jgi:hypothetical protein
VSRTTGVASAINMYVDASNRATRLVAALYSDHRGHPGSRLAAGSTASPRAGAWNSLAIRPTRVTRGRAYWIAVLGTGGRLYLRALGGGRCAAALSHQRVVSSMPSRWIPGRQWSSCPLSGYVSGKLAPSNGTASSPIRRGPFAPAPSSPSAPAGPSAPNGLSTLPQLDPPVLPPVNSAAPVVSGSPVEGATLTTSTGTWIGSPDSYGYAWEDCDSLGLLCSTIGGATSSTYTLAAGDVGHTVRSVVTATNAGGSMSAGSAQTAVVTVPPAPSNTGLPVVSGSAQQGQVLSTSNGSWSNSPSSYAYKWEDCDSSGAGCVVIGGATGSSYTLAAGDVGHTVRSVVTASNAGGSAAASSAQTGVVAGRPAGPPN